MQKSMLQLREKAVQHGYIYWWEFKNPLNTLSWRNQCNTLIFNKGKQYNHLLILGLDGVLKIWINMED